MTKIEKYIDKKVNSKLSDKKIPFNSIPDSLKRFWAEYYQKNVLIILLLIFVPVNAQKQYVGISFDVRNAITGSESTKNHSELDLLVYGGVTDKNGITLEVGYENFKAIEFQKLYFGLGYTFYSDKMEYSATIEPTYIYRDWNDGRGIYCYGSIGGSLKAKYNINDNFGISILGNCLIRTDLSDKYKESSPKVYSVYAGITYTFNNKN